jgi:tetratricopeptide (TPR) repeat protein
MKDVSGINAKPIIQHEYVHFLSRNQRQGAITFPKWFEEGFAEYLGASESRRGKFYIGKTPEHRVDELANIEWIPLKKIISPDNYNEWTRDQQSTFYAEAWALVHYLQSSKTRQATYSKDMAAYLSLLNSGIPNIEAFEKGFNIDIETLALRLRRYVELKQFSYFAFDEKGLLPSFEPTVVSLSKAQASLGLASIALNHGKWELAKDWYTIAATDKQTQARAEAGLGDLLKFRNEFEAALPHFEKAIALSPTDPYLQIDLAEYWHDYALEESNIDYLQKARQYYLEAWKLDNSIPEIYTMYGRTYLYKGEDVNKAIEMLEQSRSLLPSFIPTRVYLARAYLSVERFDEARELAESILTWSHGNSAEAKQAKKILEEIEAKSI